MYAIYITLKDFALEQSIVIILKQLVFFELDVLLECDHMKESNFLLIKHQYVNVDIDMIDF